MNNPTPISVRPSRWLSDLCESYPEISSRKINCIKLPGSHDSGSYTKKVFTPRLPLFKFAKWNWRTQRGNIRDQLDNGLRYFDLRFGKRIVKGEVKFAPHHGIMPETGDFLTSSSGKSCIREQIMSWIVESGGRELVVIDLCHFEDLTSADFEIFWDQFLHADFLRRCLPRSDVIPTLSQMWDMGHCVIVMTETSQDNIPEKYRHVVWQRFPSYWVEDIWQSGSPDQIRSYIESKFPEQHTFWVAQCQLTPRRLGRISSLCRRMNPERYVLLCFDAPLAHTFVVAQPQNKDKL